MKILQRMWSTDFIIVFMDVRDHFIGTETYKYVYDFIIGMIAKYLIICIYII